MTGPDDGDRCAICGGSIAQKALTEWKGGNNAWPVEEGQCCDPCNNTFVFRARISAHWHERSEKGR